MLLNRILNNTDQKWRPIVKALEAAIGKNGGIRRKEELLTYINKNEVRT